MPERLDVYLRPLQLEDAKVSYKWRNNPLVWKHTGSAPNCEVTLEMEMQWLSKALADSSTKRYAICLKHNNRYIGNAYLSDIVDARAEEQIFIGDPMLWGRGLGTKARLELYKIAQTELGITVIESNIRTRNLASLKSVLRCGFEEVSRTDEWVKLRKIMGGWGIVAVMSSWRDAA